MNQSNVAKLYNHVHDEAVDVAIVLITLNEEHNLQGLFDNVAGWAREVFVVDSFSKDRTVTLALENGAHVVQHEFKGFGDQWNFAIDNLPISAAWTLKLDPDERLSDQLKMSIGKVLGTTSHNGFTMDRHLWFMGKRMPVRQKITRMWRTGYCRFSDVDVNEHPVIEGSIQHLSGRLEHLDSPNLEHWYEKQNRYTSAEAKMMYCGEGLSAVPRLLGNKLERRMWLKKNFYRLPLRYRLLFVYNYLVLGAWRAGYIGYIWARLRSDVMRSVEYKKMEMEKCGPYPAQRYYGAGSPDPALESRE